MEFLLVIALIVLCLGPSTARLLTGKGDVFGPEVMVSLFYFLYGIGAYVSLRSSRWETNLALPYLFGTCLGAASLRLGMGWARMLRVPRFKELLAIDLRDVTQAAVLLATFALPSLWTYFSALGGIGGALQIRHTGAYFLAFQHSFVIGSGVEWLFLAGVLLFYVGAKRKRSLLAGAGALIWLAWASFHFLMGTRSHIVYTLIIALALWHYGIRMLRPRPVIAFLLIGILFAHTVGLGRVFLSQGLVRSVSATATMLSKSPNLLSVWKSGEFTMPGLALSELLGDESFSFRWGSSYAFALVAQVPVVNRILARDHVTPPEWRAREFYPAFYHEGGGLAFFTPAEGYFNFGWLGVFVHMLIYGFLAGLLFQVLRSYSGEGGILLYSLSLPILAIDGMRDSVSSPLWKLTHSYLFALLLIVLIAEFRRLVGRRAG